MSFPSSLPLSALRAFAEVGRCGSITLAAADLGVTPGAVSQQVKALEDRLGLTLLERRHRQVRLTAEGLRLFEATADGFARIAAGYEALSGRKRRPQTLTISTTPSFAASWLAGRIGAFQAAHPGIDLRIETSPQLVDLHRDPIDIAIRHGGGDYPGLSVERLFTPHLIPVASPALLANGPPIRTPADCLAFPLLQDRDRRDWALWLNALGVQAGDRARRGASLPDDALLIRAAAAGQGLAVVRDVYAGDDLAAGRIVTALDAPVPTGLGYFLVARPDRVQTSRIAAFRQWILTAADAP